MYWLICKVQCQCRNYKQQICLAKFLRLMSVIIPQKKKYFKITLEQPRSSSVCSNATFYSWLLLTIIISCIAFGVSYAIQSRYNENTFIYCHLLFKARGRKNVAKTFQTSSLSELKILVMTFQEKLFTRIKIAIVRVANIMTLTLHTSSHLSLKKHL